MPRSPMTLRDAALAVVKRLRDQGHEAFWAGGCVRDMLLGHDPTDYDVATDAPPQRIVELFRHTRQVGASFGVVMVRQGRHWIETATFRSDHDYADGRHPERVEFTTAEQDAARRDFTVNGMFYDPLEERVIDYVNGQADLKDGLIRAIGEPSRRFAEDHLRMLRAVRFAERLQFEIEPATADAIRAHAEQIVRISPERIREELEKMFTRPRRGHALRRTFDVNLLGCLWPDSGWDAPQVELAGRVLDGLRPDADFTLSFAAMLHDRSPREVARVGGALRCSNDQISDARWLVTHLDAIEQCEILSLPAFKKLMAHARFGDLLDLHAAVCRARAIPLDANAHARQRAADIPQDEVAPPPLITGEDLIAAGLAPGPAFKTILETLYDEQLDNRLKTREDALQKMRQIITDRDVP